MAVIKERDGEAAPAAAMPCAENQTALPLGRDIDMVAAARIAVGSEQGTWIRAARGRARTALPAKYSRKLPTL